MSPVRILCCGCLLLVSVMANAANIRLQLKGLSGQLEKNVRIQLSTIESDEVTDDQRFRARISESVRSGLKALGYYQPEIHFALLPPPVNGRRQVLQVTVDAGKPVLLAGTRVNLRGGARTDADFQALLEKRPAIGTVLNQGDYDDFKKLLANLALNKGYFDAEFDTSQLGIALSRQQAFWDLDYNSGERYRFGTVSFSGSQINHEYLSNLTPFKSGEVYQASDLAEFNRRLSAVGWFNSVVVAPQFAQSRESKMLPVQAVVTPRQQNSVDLGIGYSTDVGPRLKANWRKPWVNQYGQSVNTSSSISAVEQQLDFSYKIPLLKNPLQQYYLLQGGFKRTDLNDTRANSASVAALRYWDLSSGWQPVINLRWSLDHFTQANVTHSTMLLYPGVMISRTRSRGGIATEWGDTQRYSVDYSSSLWRSNVNFLILQAQNVWIRSLGEKNRFLIRANLGWIDSDDFNRIPPDLRFFAGGDRSIRGYKHKSVSPKDQDGKLTGASKLVTGSLEYQYNVTGKWWGAVFVDSGKAVNKFTDGDFKTGAGFGVRWVSPLGPVKLDLAVPLGDKTVHGVQLYIGLGPEL